MKKNWKIITSIALLLAICISIYIWNDNRKQREMVEQALGNGIRPTYKRSAKSKEEARRKVNQYSIELQQSNIKDLQQKTRIQDTQDNRQELNRAIDKLERMKEAEHNRQMQWEMMQDNKN